MLALKELKWRSGRLLHLDKIFICAILCCYLSDYFEKLKGDEPVKGR